MKCLRVGIIKDVDDGGASVQRGASDVMQRCDIDLTGSLFINFLIIIKPGHVC